MTRDRGERLVIHSILDNLGLGVKRGSKYAWPSCDMPGVQKWKSDLAEAPKFLLTKAALSCVDSMPDGVRVKTCLDMISAGVFKLPFEEVVIQAAMLTPENTDKVVAIHLVTVGECEIRKSPDDTIFKCRVFSEFNEARGHFYLIPAEIWIRLSPDVVGTYECFSTTAPWYSDHVGAVDVHDFLRRTKVYLEMCMVFTTATILLNGTSGVVRRQVRSDPTSARLAKLRRKTPEFSHTVLELHQEVQSAHGKTYVDSTGRTRPRLHWRRGHERMQTCGPGSRDRKKIWVSAFLVGYSDDGEVTHDYSVK